MSVKVNELELKEIENLEKEANKDLLKILKELSLRTKMWKERIEEKEQKFIKETFKGEISIAKLEDLVERGLAQKDVHEFYEITSYFFSNSEFQVDGPNKIRHIVVGTPATMIADDIEPLTETLDEHIEFFDKLYNN